MGHLKKFKNRNGDRSAHSSDWVIVIYTLIYRDSGRAVGGGGSRGGVGRSTLLSFSDQGLYKILKASMFTFLLKPNTL